MFISLKLQASALKASNQPAITVQPQLMGLKSPLEFRLQWEHTSSQVQ